MNMFKRVFGYVFSIGIIGALLLGVWNHQSIADWYRLRDYVPPMEIAALAENIELTEYGQKLFYVHYPRLETAEEFNQSCSIAEQTIVLGCYKTNQSIHIFDVEDERLQGIREVTAAHEMLHAAYDRLSDKERQEVDAMTVTFFDSIKEDNPRLRDVIKSYADRDPSVVNNELHSILATEIGDLPNDLEAHYQAYFTDRSAVVAYSRQYEEVFTRQQQQIQSLQVQMSELEESLQSRRGGIEQQEDELQTEANRLNQLRESDNTQEYNAAVPGYNALVNSYRSQLATYNADVQRLNSLIEQFNELAVQQKGLYNAIDSRQLEL